MLYHNPQIIRNGGDLRIAGFHVQEGEELSFLDVITRTKTRMQRLVTQHIKRQMEDGTSREDAIRNTTRLIQAYLTINDKDYPDNEEQIADEIEKSFEFQTWESSVYYRFMNLHTGKVSEDTPIQVSTEYNPSVSEDMIREVEYDDSLWLVLEGLVSETIVK